MYANAHTCGERAVCVCVCVCVWCVVCIVMQCVGGTRREAER